MRKLEIQESHYYDTKPPRSTFDGAQRDLAHCKVCEVEPSGPYSQSAGILHYLGGFTQSFYPISSSRKSNWIKSKKPNLFQSYFREERCQAQSSESVLTSKSASTWRRLIDSSYLAVCKRHPWFTPDLPHPRPLPISCNIYIALRIRILYGVKT